MPPVAAAATAAAAADQKVAQSSEDPSTRKSTASLKVDTTGTRMNTPTWDDRKSPSFGGSAQDSHPFARGAVIEVWHIPKKQQDDEDDDDDWWSSEESSDDEAVDDEGNPEQTDRTVRLCDIIDRAQRGASWKYYVHYRDFNRRMDEWIGISRIVSPPSVGNAKARALKREQERHRKRQLLQQQASAPRGRRRAGSVMGNAITGGAAGDRITPTAGVLDADGRRTRLSRRKSSFMNDGDDATVVASNNAAWSASFGGSAGATTDLQQQQSYTEEDVSPSAAQKDATAQPAAPAPPAEVKAASVTTTTVGEHTVATVQAVELDEHEGLDEASLREHEEVTKIKNVGFLELGRYQMETWYFSPLPNQLVGPSQFLDVLYVCEFTLRMFARKSELRRYQAVMNLPRYPPGNEIYRNGDLAMFEVDGLEEKIYCQNLCYIAKLFLDHKTLYYDVDPFLFYVLCEVDNRGYHPVGYYSKEKYSDVGYNLACILSFPCYQRKGYGRFLIAFSYELTKKEERVGSPEKPMSDLGQQAYKPYWASTIIDFLLNQSDESALSIMDIAKRTSIMAEDIVYTLNQLGILKIINNVYFIAAEQGLLQELAKKYPVKEPRVDPSKLHWTPFLTDVKRDKFSIHSKKLSVEAEGGAAVATAVVAATTTQNNNNETNKTD